MEEKNERPKEGWIKWFHQNVSAYLAVAIITVYSIDVGDWTAFFLVPAGILVMFDLMYQIPVYFLTRAWLRTVWEWLKWCVRGSWAAAILGVEYLKKRWLGQVFLALTSVHCIGFSAYWVYSNLGTLVDIIRSTWTLCVELFQHLLDPVSLMTAFRIWIRSIFVGKYLEWARKYVLSLKIEIETNQLASLWDITVGTALLGVITVIIYGAYMFPYGKVLVWMGVNPATVADWQNRTWLELVRMGCERCRDECAGNPPRAMPYAQGSIDGQPPAYKAHARRQKRNDRDDDE